MTGNALQNIEQIESSHWSIAADVLRDPFHARQEFDFILANPPYGKSWKKGLDAMDFPGSAQLTPADSAQ